jgi:hypothetical protein
VIQGDIVKSEYNNQLPYHPSPTVVKGEGIKLITMFVIKKSIVLVSNYSIQYQIMNIVSVYGFLIRTKNSLNTHSSSFASSLLPVIVSHTRLQQ